GPREATTTIVYYIYKNAFEWFNMGYACAQAVFLLMILLLATLVQMRFQRRWVFYG
ncbi:MAG: sugar ABC transporter permease, partial [Thermotoga sp.]